MARRITISVLALVAVLLGTVALPLGLITASSDRHDYQDQTIDDAATLVGVAEEQLADHFTGLPLARAMAAWSTVATRRRSTTPTAAAWAGTWRSPACPPS